VNDRLVSSRKWLRQVRSRLATGEKKLMLLQTNSYVVPKERRAEHQRLLRRFRQTLARLGCEHFEVYEQVGPNWTASENAGRYVQIMRFRDRRHQLSVQSAERADPGAQAVIAEFCNLINFPYQQQQGLFAVGYYQSALPVTMRREATRAEVAASDAAAPQNEPEAEESVDESAEMERAEEEVSVASAADRAAESDEEVELKAEAESGFDEEEADEDEAAHEEGAAEENDDLKAGKGAVEAEPDRTAEPAIPEKAEAAGLVEETEKTLAVEGDDAEATEKPDQEEAVEALSTGSTDSTSSRQEGAAQVTAEELPAAELSLDDFEAFEEDEAASPDAALAVEEKLFAGEEAGPVAAELALAAPAELAGPAEEAVAEVAVRAEAEIEFDETVAGHADTHEQLAGAIAGEPEWAEEAELAPEAGEGAVEAQAEPEGMEEVWDEAEAAEAVELSAEEGDFEIIYEQLPATADEAGEDEAGEPETIEEGGFDALLSNEQLLEGFDAEDELLHGAAHAAELHAHGAPGGRNGNSLGGARNDPRGQATEAGHGRMR
jgi:hypothetical protein